MISRYLAGQSLTTGASWSLSLYFPTCAYCLMAQRKDAQLSTLVELLANATKIVEKHYAQTDKPYVPSLDDIDFHPLDGASILDKELKEAIQTIEGACAQLSASVARPSRTMVNRLMSVFESSCYNVAITFKIPDILRDRPEGASVSEIAEKAGVDERKLARVLRSLASRHCFREVERNVFANNRLSLQLLSDNPVSSLGLHFTDECMKSSALLSETLADSEWGRSYRADQSAFNRYTGLPGTLFDYYEGDSAEGASRGARFGVGMMGWGSATESGAVVQAYPWDDLHTGATVCDVGGGIGNITMQLAKKHRKLELILQDLPDRIVQAKSEVWPKECPEAVAEDRIRFEPVDFFKESPVSGCDVYYMKNIIHDWPDVDSVKILSNVRQAMGLHSRLLIQEYILQHVNREPNDKSQFSQAPEPLLSNYGVGRILQYNLDLDMMTMLNSEERTVSDFVRLGEAAGLKFKKVWDFGEMGMVEFRLPSA
ncbi:O-methyltransferase-domain-containing protein [Cyathus striatus]|nr:O-methyltransferase-domain-containing protein [Cyathus striatus]